MITLTRPGPSRSTLTTSNSSSIPNSTAVAFGILAASLLDVVRDQQHAEAASPYPSGTPLKFEEPPRRRASTLPSPLRPEPARPGAQEPQGHGRGGVPDHLRPTEPRRRCADVGHRPR